MTPKRGAGTGARWCGFREKLEGSRADLAQMGGAPRRRHCSRRGCGPAYAGSERGPNRITLIPTRQIAAPITSHGSGRLPSIAQPHNSALAM